MAEGKGRLIHSDGDVFIGRWQKDKGYIILTNNIFFQEISINITYNLNTKAHGFGEYFHLNGATY